MQPQIQKSSLEFRQGCSFVHSVANAIRGRFERFRLNLIRSSGPSSSCGEDSPWSTLSASHITAVQRSEVRHMGQPSIFLKPNRLNSPSVSGGVIAVIAPAHQISVGILSEFLGIEVRIGLCFAPHGGAGQRIEGFVSSVRIVFHRFVSTWSLDSADPAKRGVSLESQQSGRGSLLGGLGGLGCRNTNNPKDGKKARIYHT